jgi:GTP-binding protein HflX
MHETEEPITTAVIGALQLNDVSDTEHQSHIAELKRLLKTLGYEVVGVVTQKRRRPEKGAVFGSGKLLELAAYTGGTGIVPSSAPKAKSNRSESDDKGDGVEAPEAGNAPEGEESQEPEVDLEPDDSDPSDLSDLSDLVDPMGAPILGAMPHADVVVIDHEITPRQARNLERATEAEVIDRTGVIVDIFHRHAQTREARLQVEIARLTYVVPRLRAGVSGGDRQRGGIGGKGAGESSLELDRRKVRDRVSLLRAELAEVAREDQTRRQRRKGLRRVALVGYTNAGKSSLMRALTGSEVLVEDKLFATLGTTVRALQPEIEPRILVSDTVGFIRRLPHDLVASFRSTLEEAREASLLLYVVDSSDPDFRAQLEVTKSVLAEIVAANADGEPMELQHRLVLNKIDKVDAAQRDLFLAEFPDAIQLSAHEKADVSMLRQRIIEFFEGAYEEAQLFVPYANGKLAAEMRATLSIVHETHDEHGTTFTVSAPASAIARVRTRLG